VPDRLTLQTRWEQPGGGGSCTCPVLCGTAEGPCGLVPAPTFLSAGGNSLRVREEGRCQWEIAVWDRRLGPCNCDTLSGLDQVRCLGANPAGLAEKKADAEVGGCSWLAALARMGSRVL
jgi:hypothetical protein